MNWNVCDPKTTRIPAFCKYSSSIVIVIVVEGRGCENEKLNENYEHAKTKLM